MDYFKILNLEREPFSNSPDPAFFYSSTQHLECLQQLELAIRLRRGLNVVIGDVGTGKTTLCRELIHRLALTESDNEVIENHLILDPSFSDPLEFLRSLKESFGLPNSDCQKTEWQLKEDIKTALFQKAVGEGKNIVLIIDEGQKISAFCLEILREFLNYETNESKLLQIVIFAQLEFQNIIEKQANLTDRINLFYKLQPLSFRETRAMILFRIQRASSPGVVSPSFFTLSGYLAIYRETGGYPRKINALCHQMLLTLIIQNCTKGGWRLAHSCARRTQIVSRRQSLWPAVAGVLALVIVLAGVCLWPHFTFVQKTFASPSPRSARSTVVTSSGYPGIAESMPTSLGSLTVMKGNTVTSMVQAVYGDPSLSMVGAVLQANPGIRDVKHVAIGTKLRFPAIPSKRRPGEGILFVSIAHKQTLETAFQVLRNFTEKQTPVRILPYWNPREGLVFDVILKKGFVSKEKAIEALHELPLKIAGSAKILDSWNSSTVLYGQN